MSQNKWSKEIEAPDAEYAPTINVREGEVLIADVFAEMKSVSTDKGASYLGVFHGAQHRDNDGKIVAYDVVECWLPVDLRFKLKALGTGKPVRIIGRGKVKPEGAKNARWHFTVQTTGADADDSVDFENIPF